MATYLELQNLRSNSDLQDKVAVACVKKAQTLIDSTSPTANAITWAEEVLRDPRSKGLEIINYVLAKNSAATVSAIQEASDETIQTAVSGAVDKLIA